MSHTEKISSKDQVTDDLLGEEVTARDHESGEWVTGFVTSVMEPCAAVDFEYAEIEINYTHTAKLF